MSLFSFQPRLKLTTACIIASLSTSFAGTVFANVDQLHAPDHFDTIRPEAVHSDTLKSIMQSLNYDHFRQIKVNDQFSKQVFSHYLSALDPLKLHFTQEDVQKFKKYENQFDDVIKSGKLDIPFTIFNFYRDKSAERFTYMLNHIDDQSVFDFTQDETLNIEREEGQYAKDQKALETIWHKQLKESALRLSLADKTTEEIKDLLKRRFTAKLNYLAQTNPEDVFQGFMNTVTELYDPHTQYLSPRASDNFNINMSLSLEGIGAVLQTEDEYTKVVRLVPGGPADQSGQIKPLDKILAVGSDPKDLTDIVGWRIDEVVSQIRGPKGTDIYLEVQSADSKTKVTNIIKITRNTVKLEDQAARSDILKINRGDKEYSMGVIEVPAFYADFSGRSQGQKDYRRVSDDVERILNTPEMKMADGIIIDLRANGGGSLQEANRLIGLFLKTGPTVQIKNTREQVSLNRDSDPKIASNQPIVVLIDRLSASASEIFAGAIQDYQRGIVLGSRSFGKGTVQILRALDHGQLKMTHAKFYRISGESNQHQGIIPDIEMVSSYDPSEVGESALENALPWDTIKPAQFKPFYNLDPIKPLLSERHLQRLEGNIDYQYLVNQTDLLQELRDDSVVHLNKQARSQEMHDLEAKRLSLENNRRKAKGEDEFKTYEEFESYESKKNEKEADQIVKADDVVLMEAGQVLADMIDLERDNVLVSNMNTEENTSLLDFFGEILN
ncbi:MAG: carboxy terminal-processing peptidase [Pseudomonadota bacterium]|nr:carboxy terminal-processing peptidase [Pseudomonadota bacterium]